MGPLQRSLLGAGEPGVDERAIFDRRELGGSSWVEIARGWLRGADDLLDSLVRDARWRRGRRRMFDRVVDDPRLSCTYGAGETPPHQALGTVRAALSDRYRAELGAITLNFYRDGNDSVAFHRDRELRHLEDTLVAIVTLGAMRPFLLRPLGGGASIDLRPGSGDLLVMGGRCQAAWEHCVPKVRKAGPRVSASLRWTKGEDGHGSHRAFQGGDVRGDVGGVAGRAALMER